MENKKDESSDVLVDISQPVAGICTRAQIRRLSIQPSPQKKLAKTSPIKSLNSIKSPSKSSPPTSKTKSTLVASKQQHSNFKIESKATGEKSIVSPKKKNANIQSPKSKMSPSKQRSPVFLPSKSSPTGSTVSTIEEETNPKPGVIKDVRPKKEIKEEEMFVDVSEIKTVGSKKENRKLKRLSKHTPDEVHPEDDVKEEIFSDISNDIVVKKMRKLDNVPVIENVKEEEVESADNLKKVKSNKSSRVNDKSSKPTLVSKDEAMCVQIHPSKIVSASKHPATPGKEKHFKKKAVIEDNSESDEDSDAESRKEIMRSAEKRIIRNISTSESESRNVHSSKMSNIGKDSTDSDSAPEDITFDASRKSAMDILKHTVDSIKRDKQKKKEKRKERLELLRQQKEENLIRLKERKANLEDASCSSSEESTHEKNGLNTYGIGWLSKGKKTYFEEETGGKKSNSTRLAENSTGLNDGVKQSGSLKRLPSDLLENLPDKLPKKKKIRHLTTDPLIQKEEKHGIAKIKEFKKNRDIDFLPLESSSSTQFGVVALNTQKLKTVNQEAANFRHNMLYGSRVQRVPANTHIKNRHKSHFVQS